MSYWFMGAAIVASIGATAYSTDQARKNANTARDAQIEAAKKQAALQEEALGKESQKAPDVSSLLSANEKAAKGGQSSTTLTGASGISADQLSLGKRSTLLGGG